MKRYLSYLFLIPLLIHAACTRMETESGVGVAFSVSGASDTDIDILSKTSLGADGVTVSWDGDDKVYLWAENSAEKMVLSGQEFTVFGMDGSRAFFTSNLKAAMPEDSYDYWCCTPSPLQVDGVNALFDIPSEQNGRGEGIMIADKVTAGPLRPLDEYVETDGLSMKMYQALHLLQLRVEDPLNILNGEKITEVRLSFPSDVAGTCRADITDHVAGMELVDGKSMLTVHPESPVAISGEFYATICPSSWQLSDAIGVKIYSETKVADGKDILLKRRTMLSGHATPICLTPLEIKNFCTFHLALRTNPVGEDVTKITLTAPSGCKWGDKGTNILILEDADGIGVGPLVDITFEEENLFRNFSGKTITVNYESEHLLMSQTITIPNLSGIFTSDLNLDVPEILCEDFHAVGTFSSNDEYKTSKAGSYDAYSFLNGWTGGRIGAEAGKCIRIACRRETSADYDARVDSAPVNCKFRKNTDLKVEFTYGSNNRYSTFLIDDGNVGQTCYVGYVTSTKAYESGAGDGVFDRNNNSFYTKEYSGKFDNTPNDMEVVIRNIPAGTSPVRITWHTEVEHKAGAHNTTAWLYIDNIKVTIAK